MFKVINLQFEQLGKKCSELTKIVHHWIFVSLFGVLKVKLHKTFQIAPVLPVIVLEILCLQ